MEIKGPYLNLGRGLHETPRYACVLTSTVSTYIPMKGYDLIFRAGGQILGKLNRTGLLTICSGYACDGYTPTLRVVGRWLRLTPTPRAGMFPAIMHDFTRQFCEVPLCPWTRDDSDQWFYDSLVAGGTNPNIAGTYYTAVSGVIGDVWFNFRKQDPTLSVARDFSNPIPKP